MRLVLRKNFEGFRSQAKARRLMPYHLLADMAVLAHALFVIFVVVGGMAVLRWPRVAWLHLPAVVWGSVVELTGWTCPLTYLENRFRRLGGEAGYGGDFIEHCLEPVLYPFWLTPGLQLFLGLGLLAINIAVYVRLWKKLHREG